MDNVNPNREKLIGMILEANGIKDTEKIRKAMRQFGNKTVEFEQEKMKCEGIENIFKNKFTKNVFARFDIFRRSWVVSFDTNAVLVSSMIDHMVDIMESSQADEISDVIGIPKSGFSTSFDNDREHFTLEIFKL